jgi:hypothetical protein
MLQTRKTLAKLDARHLDTLARIDLRAGTTDIDTHSIGIGTDIDTHSIAYEKVGYKASQNTTGDLRGVQFRHFNAKPTWSPQFPLLDRAGGKTYLDPRHTARDNPSKFRAPCCYSKKCFSHRLPGGAKILWSSASSHHKLATDPKSGHQIPLNFEAESANYGNGACSEAVFATNYVRRVAKDPIAKFSTAEQHFGTL